MNPHEKYAFVDEFGDSGLDFTKSGTTTHFIVTAVIVDQKDLAEMERKAESIRKRHFQSGEMKSSKIKGKIKRRRAILEDLSELNVHLYALVVHKRKLRDLSKGYSFYKSFYKNLHGKLEHGLLKTHPDLLIVADEYSDKEFMEGFRKYVQNRYIHKNFLPLQEIEFANSKDSVLIQVADFFAGTIARAFDETKASDEGKMLFRQIKNLLLDEFPYEPESYVVEAGLEEEMLYSRVISRLAIHSAVDFINRFEKDEDLKRIDQIACTRFLLDFFKFKNPDEYIPTHEIVRQVNLAREKPLDEDGLRRDVIPRLRDAGVLITSRSTPPAGYKLPHTVNDIYDFVNHYNSIVMPMLRRVKDVRERIQDATGFKFDVLDRQEYLKLKNILDLAEVSVGME